MANDIAKRMRDNLNAHATNPDHYEMDCYECAPWINGYGRDVLVSLVANVPDLNVQWYHSGGGIMGIFIQREDPNGINGMLHYFIGAADEPNIGMDITTKDGTMLGYGEFGSLDDMKPKDMAKRIWDGITNGKGVTNSLG